ncbi:amylase cluster transcriptional regulator AmyR [Pochonia chlamydosporia 170]|uniref:Amylase cluster transcriptional regulator AmyR n=1 Tax=Pochonia chlamydosporia 170 TaxID=1380566 RepID=A0A179FRM5_METCM|nr:amylase cluster transcriptional regulator AmyR [Pochonia chlamydosporia 170]OAQ67743.1 amylase cluster transcriptional regulator AmyR [Pochonia chlamydosporia 170]
MSFANLDTPNWHGLPTSAESSVPSDSVTASSASYESPASMRINQGDVDGRGFEALQSRSDSASACNILTPLSSWPRMEEASSLQLPSTFFEPYVRLFVDRLYPIFPVLDSQYLLGLVVHLDDNAEPPSITKAEYALLSSLTAATIVQLNMEDSSTVPGVISPCGDESDHRSGSHGIQVPSSSAQFFVSQCRQTRQEYDFIQELDESTILTSFFLFAYYGNLDQSRLAWYYLHEAIGFAQSLGLDNPETYIDLSTAMQQQRCRLFWLLFISERAFAIQHRRQVVLRPSIDFPKVFDSHNPKLIYGFVALTKVFKSIDDDFISRWRSSHDHHRGEVVDYHKTTASLLNDSDLAGVLSISEIDDTQKLDVLVTQQWLRILVYQIHLRRPPSSFSSSANLEQNTSEARGKKPKLASSKFDYRHIVDTCKNLMQVLSRANRVLLEAHGIGMEQKISDAANCLCDVLTRQAASDISNEMSHRAPELLHRYMVFLSFFRNHESQYFQPLQQKAGLVLTQGLHMSCLPMHDCSVDQMPPHCQGGGGGQIYADEEASPSS